MRVTVVIPSYNHHQYVAQAIESVLDQSWPDVDLIVIDDGSTDGSPAVIQDLLDRRGGFRFVSRENRGVSKTLNEGLRLAEGDAFCLLASDDYLLEHSLESRASILSSHPEAVAVFSDGILVDEHGLTVGTVVRAEKKDGLFQAKDPVPLFLKGMNLPIHTMMVRIAALRKIGGFDQRYQYCEDLDVQLLLFLEGEVRYHDALVYAYRNHGAGISKINRHVARADKVMCFKKYLEEVPALRPYEKLIRKRLRKHFVSLGRYLLANKKSARTLEKNLFETGWDYFWPNLKLFYYLSLWGIAKKIR